VPYDEGSKGEKVSRVKTHLKDVGMTLGGARFSLAERDKDRQDVKVQETSDAGRPCSSNKGGRNHQRVTAHLSYRAQRFEKARTFKES